jgi:hypothetical protein
MLAEFFTSIIEELDARAGKQLRATKPEVFEELPEEIFEATSRAPDSSALLSSSSNLCFVLMPFTETFNDIYNGLIKPVLWASGLETMRADQVWSSPVFAMEKIRAAIQQSRLCVADLTGRNPNVLYELGIAQTLGKPTILLSQNSEDIPYDLRLYDVIIYKFNTLGLEEAKQVLTRSVQAVLGLDKLDEARRLIHNGMFRAGAALLGILLEHSLRHLLIQHGLIDVKTGEYFSRPLPMGRMIELLLRAKIISQVQSSALREGISVRNRAVHHLVEPSAQEAGNLLKIVESFVRQYIANSEQGALTDSSQRPRR